LIFLLLILGLLFFFPYLTEGWETFNLRQILATVLIAVYGLIYCYFPPVLSVPNQHIGKLFELLPLACYAKILYVDEYPNIKEKISLWFAYFGWAIVFLILLYFKVYVW